MTWLTNAALKLLGLTPTLWNFIRVYVLPFVANNWTTIAAVLPVVTQFIRTASSKDISGQEKQDYVVSLLRKELVNKNVVSKEEDASTSLLQLIVLVAYRFVSHKDPDVVAKPVEEVK